MSINKYINIDNILVLVLSLFLFIGLVNHVSADNRMQTSIKHQDNYSKFHKEAAIETEKLAQTIVDLILNEAERYNIYPEEDVKIYVQPIVYEKLLNFDSLSRFINKFGSQMNLPINLINDLEIILTQFYQNKYDILALPYEKRSSDYSLESILAPEGGNGENIYDIALLATKNLLDAEDTISIEISNAKQFNAKTNTTSARKQNFHKPIPKSTYPPLNADTCTITQGINKSDNSIDSQIEDVDKAPIFELDNENIDEIQLYDTKERAKLREIRTKSIEENIEKEWKKFIQKNKDPHDNFFMGERDYSAKIEEGESEVLDNVLEAFLLYNKTQDLEKRYREWNSSLEKIELVTLEIKELTGIIYDISNKRSKYPKML